MIIGLTGGIASGKSTVSKIIIDMGIKVIDADIVAREVMRSDQVLKRVLEEFGEDMLDKDGNLDRARLRKEIFSSKEKVRILNSIVHPLVIKRFEEERERAVKIGELIVFDVPLLFEAKMDSLCDKILVIYVDGPTQIKRIIDRDGSSMETAKNIIANQMPVEEKLEKADIAIKNDGTLESLKKKVESIFLEFKNIKEG